MAPYKILSSYIKNFIIPNIIILWARKSFALRLSIEKDNDTWYKILFIQAIFVERKNPKFLQDSRHEKAQQFEKSEEWEEASRYWTIAKVTGSHRFRTTFLSPCFESIIKR